MGDNLAKFIAFLAVATLLSAAIGLVVMDDAEGHEFYETDCCNDRDCAPAAPGDVVEGPNGYEIKSLGITVPYNDEKVRQAPDGQFHICATPTMKHFLCLYVPGRGF